MKKIHNKIPYLALVKMDGDLYIVYGDQWCQTCGAEGPVERATAALVLECVPCASYRERVITKNMEHVYYNRERKASIRADRLL